MALDDIDEEVIIPLEVTHQVGDRVTIEFLQEWWVTPNDLLWGDTPESAWKAGEERIVLSILGSIKTN